MPIIKMGIKNTIKSIGKFIFNIKEENKIIYPVHEELIKRDKIIQAQQQVIQGRDAQLSKISAEENKKKEEEQSKNYKEELIKRINGKDAEIRGRRFNHTFDLRYFFNKLGPIKNPTKFSKEIEVTDKDDNVTFGIFGTIIIADNGYMLVTDSKGEILHMAKDFTQLIWKPNSLVNYMKRKRIPLAVDENLKPVIDIEELEVKDVLYDENEILTNEEGENIIDTHGNPIKGAYKNTVELERPLRDLLIERDERYRELRRYTERMEMIMISQKNKNDDLNRAMEVYKNKAETYQTQTSQAISGSMAKETAFADLHGQIVHLTNQNKISEVMNEKQKTIISSLLNALEESGVKTVYRKAREEVQDYIEWAKRNTAQIVYQEKEKEAVNTSVQPGQIVRP